MSGTAKPCGLYRTTTALSGHAEAVSGGLLVYFHNHSDTGTPMVQLPESNEHNRWKFFARGHSISDDSFVDSLQPLKAEGYYRVSEHFHPDAHQVVAKNTLAQLGYTRDAKPLLFFPRVLDGDNALVFPAQGVMITSKIYGLLEELDVRGPHAPRKLH